MNSSRFPHNSNSIDALTSGIPSPTPEDDLSPAHFGLVRTPQGTYTTEALALSQISRGTQKNFMPGAPSKLPTLQNRTLAATTHLPLMDNLHQNLESSAPAYLSPIKKPNQNLTTSVPLHISSKQNPYQNLASSSPEPFSSTPPSQSIFVPESHENRFSAMIVPTFSSQQGNSEQTPTPQKENDGSKICFMRMIRLCLKKELRVQNSYWYQTDEGMFVFRPQYLEMKFSDLYSPLVQEENDNADYNDSLNQMVSYKSGKNIDFYVMDSQDCIRCKTKFSIKCNGKESDDACKYHPGKFRRTEDGSFRHLCCGAQKPGNPCLKHKFHIFKNMKYGINGPYYEIKITQPSKRQAEIFALDCEMIYTCLGLEVARVSLISYTAKILLDKIVKPEGTTIYDYYTHITGITEEDIKTGMSLNEVRDIILSYVKREDIIIGHGLENDLFALRILHRRVIDTSLLNWNRKDKSIFKHETENRLSLKDLMKKFLNKNIQENDNLGHDSIEDAIASLVLAIFYTVTFL